MIEVAEKYIMFCEIHRNPVVLHGKRIGKLTDLIIKQNGTLPEVTNLIVSRMFGDVDLLIPWENVVSLTGKEAVINISDVKQYEKEPPVEAIKLKDHIIDKKVLDIEDREVEVVYDIRLLFKEGKLLVSDVDISSFALLRRFGFSFIANIMNRSSKGLTDKIIPWKYIQTIPNQMGRFHGDIKLNVLKEKVEEMHPADLADILEEMDYRQRAKLFENLEEKRAASALEEIDPSIQRELVATLKKEKVAEILNQMTTGQAADVLAALPFKEARILLHMLPPHNIKKIKDILDKQETRILDFATLHIFEFPPTKTVREAIDEYRLSAKGKKVVMYIYVVDLEEKLLGIVDIRELLEGGDNDTLSKIMEKNVISLSPDSSLKYTLEVFERYDFRAIPIVDSHKKLLGVIPYRDMKKLKHRFLE